PQRGPPPPPTPPAAPAPPPPPPLPPLAIDEVVDVVDVAVAVATAPPPDALRQPSARGLRSLWVSQSVAWNKSPQADAVERTNSAATRTENAGIARSSHTRRLRCRRGLPGTPSKR